MIPPVLICTEEKRREAVWAARNLSGLDYVEVGNDQRILTVTFLGKAPEGIEKENVVIVGGQRIRGIQVRDIQLQRNADPAIDDTMDVTVDKPGDFSIYLLQLINLEGVDPRYASVNFSFKANCPSALDCKTPPVCPPPARPQPEINYLSKDYASFRQLILDRLSVIMPDWTERHVPDVGITLVEILAYVGDYLSYYQDAVATEAYLETARQRISVRRHVRLVDYPMHEGCNARAWVTIKTDTDLSLPLDGIYFITSYPGAPPSGVVLKPTDLENVPPERYEVFEPLSKGTVQLYVVHNEIHFYTWGDARCCLPKGTTSATLIDTLLTAPGQNEANRALHLSVGDILIFEEVLGPKTGDPADADPAHRHAAHLTSVTPSMDALFNQPILEIEWAQEDALPFPLCISALGPPPLCELLVNVSVARGNIVAVDHGRTVNEPAGTVPTVQTSSTCINECGPGDIMLVPGPFTPVLKQTPLTFSQTMPSPPGPAGCFPTQDPRQALPWVWLTSTLGDITIVWSPLRDLLSSEDLDANFVVEIDNTGAAHIRFGDGELGRAPEAGMVFTAKYRVGNGVAGNVGAEAVRLIVSKQTLGGVVLEPRNPLAAEGGIAAESMADVKLLAPHSFRSKLERAITPDDYATLAAKPSNCDCACSNSKLQKAKTTYRWTGSWYEVLVATDPQGMPEANQPLLDQVAGFLYPFRRIGHDLVVKKAQYVALDVALTVCVKPHYLRGHVEAALRDVFSNRVLPDGKLGFFHPDNLTFGDGVFLSRIVGAAQAVTGVESVAITNCTAAGVCVPLVKLQRLFETPNGEVKDGVLELGPLEIARLDNDPNYPENGRIVFDVRGGR